MKYVLIMCIFVSAMTSTVRAQTGDPAILTSSILPQELIQTNTYSIAPVVTVVDHRFQFTVETKYGTFQVASIPLLEKRMSELRAIEEIGRLRNETVAIKSAWETLKKTPRGAGHLLSDPRGVLSQVPRGIEKMASNFVDPVARRAGSEARRRLAANLGVDSETRNPVLDALLDRLVAREFVGDSATKFALSAALPGLGTLATMEDIQESIATRTPHEVVADMERELINLGVWPPVRDAFIKNSRWTLLEKITFVSLYRSLTNIQHADVMVYLANQDVSEADILRRLIEMRLLVELNTEQKIVSLTETGLPIAWLADGQIVGVCSVDYLTNPTTVQAVASGFRRANPERKITLLSTGWVSPEAGKTLAENNIDFKRAGFSENTRTGFRANQPQTNVQR